MKFQVQAGEFTRSLKPSVDIATKNTKKEFDYAFLLSIQATNEGIIASSYGGTACAISVINDECFGNIKYVCEEAGSVVVNANNFLGYIEAFPSTSIIDISVSNGSVEITSDVSLKKSKKKAKYSMPRENKEIRIPNISNNFDKSININRSVFVDGMKKVNFAIGFEDNQPYYKCQLLEITENKVRFVSGTGGRFAIKDVRGDKIVDCKEDTISFLFPKENIGNIIKIAADSSDEKILIKESEAQMKEIIPAQIIIEFKNTKIIILELDSATKYADMDKFLSYDYPYQISCNMEDWEGKLKGVKNTFNHSFKDLDEIHNTDIVLNTEEDHISIQTRTVMKVLDYIDVDIKKADQVKGKEHYPWFRCNSTYLSEMVEKMEKCGKVIINFEDQESVDSDKKSSRQPVTAIFSEKTNSNKEITENTYMIFATSSI